MNPNAPTPSQPSSPSHSSILWWVGWIGLTIGTFFLSCAFWTWFIARHVGSMRTTGAPLLWITTVFGSWMVLLLPLIIVMYQKVDKAYEDARIRREEAQAKRLLEHQQDAFKTVSIPSSQRMLSTDLQKKLKHFPETMRGGHLVSLILKNGERIETAFIVERRELLGIYGEDRLTFSIQDIADATPTDLKNLKDFKTSNWLRLDGVSAQDRILP